MGSTAVRVSGARWVRYRLGVCECVGVYACETLHYHDDAPTETVAVIICRRGKTLWTHIVAPDQIIGDAEPPRSGDEEAETVALEHAEFFRRRDERCEGVRA